MTAAQMDARILKTVTFLQQGRDIATSLRDAALGRGNELTYAHELGRIQAFQIAINDIIAIHNSFAAENDVRRR